MSGKAQVLLLSPPSRAPGVTRFTFSLPVNRANEAGEAILDGIGRTE